VENLRFRLPKEPAKTHDKCPSRSDVAHRFPATPRQIFRGLAATQDDVNFSSIPRANAP